MKRGSKFVKYFINISLTSIIIIILMCIIIEKIGENGIEESNYKAERLSAENVTNQSIDQISEYPKEDIDDTFKGYNVCAKLEIPKISLKTNILSEYSKEALSKCITKYWGVNPNEIGNFCVIGHNTKSKNMFYNLKKLRVGDNLFITDRNLGKVEYEVFQINIVLPENTDCLDALTRNEREVTLITCTSTGEKRIIIKAREV